MTQLVEEQQKVISEQQELIRALKDRHEQQEMLIWQIEQEHQEKESDLKKEIWNLKIQNSELQADQTRKEDNRRLGCRISLRADSRPARQGENIRDRVAVIRKNRAGIQGGGGQIRASPPLGRRHRRSGAERQQGGRSAHDSISELPDWGHCVRFEEI